MFVGDAHAQGTRLPLKLPLDGRMEFHTLRHVGSMMANDPLKLRKIMCTLECLSGNPPQNSE